MQRNRLTVKVIVIALLMLLLRIPIMMISSLIHERESTAESTIQEVQDKWSNAQTLVGPVLVIPYTKNDKAKSLGRKYILPGYLRIDGNVQTEVLKRGIYEIVVYNSPLKIRSCFNFIGKICYRLFFDDFFAPIEAHSGDYVTKSA